MKFNLPVIESEATPSGKRTIRQNVYGNWVGYVAGRRWKEFGCYIHAESDAAEWMLENVETGA